MEQLQRLAETIAETYIRDLIRNNGTADFTHGDAKGTVTRELLSSGLVDNCVSYARRRGIADHEREAYRLLMDMISLDGPEYQVTNHGRDVIDYMTRKALSKGALPAMH